MGDARKVFVVVEDYGLNGAGAIGVFTDRETAELLARLEPGRGTTGYGGAEVVEFIVDVLPNLDLYEHDIAWRRQRHGQRRLLDRWIELGGRVERGDDG